MHSVTPRDPKPKVSFPSGQVKHLVEFESGAYVPLAQRSHFDLLWVAVNSPGKQLLQAVKPMLGAAVPAVQFEQVEAPSFGL
jgi:hypothetical protein